MLKINKENISKDIKENWISFATIFLVIILGKSFLQVGLDMSKILINAIQDAPAVLFLLLIGLFIRFAWRGWVVWLPE